MTPAIHVVEMTKKREILEFNGMRFYRYPLSYNRAHHYAGANQTLQGAVWEFHNGPVPLGMCVHHVDHDPTNNDIRNLQLMTPSAHAKYHKWMQTMVRQAWRLARQAGYCAAA